jgi:hypothetical protein
VSDAAWVTPPPPTSGCSVVRPEVAGSSRSLIAQDQKEKTNEQKEASDFLSIEQDAGILEKRVAHIVVDPEDCFRVKQVAKPQDNKQKSEPKPQQEHIKKSSKIRREESNGEPDRL